MKLYRHFAFFPTLFVFNTCQRRGSLAFAAILVGVGLSAVGNVFASSLATMFPAVFLSTMVGLWLSHEVLNILQSNFSSLLPIKTSP